MKLDTRSIVVILKRAAMSLEGKSTTPRLDAEILLAHVLHKTRSYLYSHDDEVLPDTDLHAFELLLLQRQNGKPIAYIVGIKEFWSLEFNVNEDVLIPRPETEFIVELCLAELDKDKSCAIADLGTGSGAIAIALAYERPNWTLFAVDKSDKALVVSKANAVKYNIKNVKFFCGDWYDALPFAQKFDAILSNPPYIEKDDPHLQQGDVAHEPKSALISGITGLDDLKTIITKACKYLKINGILILEHGYDQGDQVRQLMQQNGLVKIKTVRDLAGLERISVGYKLIEV